MRRLTCLEKSMAAAWTVEGSPLQYPGAALHTKHTRTLALCCGSQTAQYVLPESDLIGCAGKAATDLSPESDSIRCAGQAAKKVSPASDSTGCAGQAAKNVSPESDPIGCAGQAAKKVDSESSPDVSQSVSRRAQNYTRLRRE